MSEVALPSASEQPKAEPTPVEPKAGQLLNLHRRPRSGLGAGGHEIKMMYPACDAQKMAVLGLAEGDACQHSQNIHAGWWDSCERKGHRPYYTPVTQTRRTPKFKQGEQAHEQVLIGYEEEIVTVSWEPNLKQISRNERINSDAGPEMYRAIGYRMPEELGVAPFCEYRECWAQDNLVRTEYGVFCSKDQARMVGAEVQGVRLEIFTQTPEGQSKREKQLREIAL